MTIKHAEIIKHMVDHGYESVEYEYGGRWFFARESITPLRLPTFNWRIRPAEKLLHIENFPTPETKALAYGETYYLLTISPCIPNLCTWYNANDEWVALKKGRVYKSKDKCNLARNLLLSALSVTVT
jgi:hypothetical protein